VVVEGKKTSTDFPTAIKDFQLYNLVLNPDNQTNGTLQHQANSS
jgi:hypothetical protein